MIENKPRLSEHAKRVMLWRESFLFLEENHFFEIMKMYLGEIKTPYNKQKLIANLEGFLHKKENLVAIKSFLSDDELEIISAVVFIPDVTEEKLSSFFKNTFTYSFLYEKLLNLEERLILFKTKNENSSQGDSFVIKFNPLLEDTLFDLININRLLPQIEFTKTENPTNRIKPELISCFISYILENPNIAKQDGTLKKYSLQNIPVLFGDEKEKIEILYKAFLNLGILKETGHGAEVDWSKFSDFLNLSFAEQTVYITISSCSHLSRESLRLHSQIFVDTVKNLSDRVFTLDLFLRTGFLVSADSFDSSSESSFKTSRFAKIIQEGRLRLSEHNSDAVTVSTSGALERMFEAAVSLGIIYISGTTKDGSKDSETVYSVSDFLAAPEQCSENLSGMLRIDSSLAVSLMPGFALRDIVPLSKFMSLKKYDKVSEFLISRQSIMRGFDIGLSAKEIIQILTERTLYEIPETLKVQIEEWNSSYSSASFYKGFVLKVDGKAALAAQHNSVLSPHIHTVIAPGIFLLDVNDDAEAVSLIKKSGLDFIGKIKSVKEENQTAGFFNLKLNGKKNFGCSGFETPSEIIPKKDSAEIEKELFLKLEQMELDESQKENLELRIEHKVIVNPAQLNSSILRLEKSNANAMDYAGKIYVFEQALANEEKIELRFAKDGKKELSVFGKPVGIRKQSDDVFVQLLLVPENVVKEFSLGKAQFIKRIKKTIY
ncbi:MAG: helicase-associated domain-containing protein [Spirochaetia bacterium]|nr:helicase-associated domain-containing protein [Spirochaetia bacterium]